MIACNHEIRHCCFVPYARAYADFSALYVELWDDADARKKRKAKAASKARYTCPVCDLHAWARPDTKLICGECEQPLSADEDE